MRGGLVVFRRYFFLLHQQHYEVCYLEVCLIGALYI